MHAIPKSTGADPACAKSRAGLRLAALLALVLSGCPLLPRRAAEPNTLDRPPQVEMGPPSVLNPALLDRG